MIVQAKALVMLLLELVLVTLDLLGLIALVRKRFYNMFFQKLCPVTLRKKMEPEIRGDIIASQQITMSFQSLGRRNLSFDNPISISSQASFQNYNIATFSQHRYMIPFFARSKVYLWRWNEVLRHVVPTQNTPNSNSNKTIYQKWWGLLYKGYVR